MCSSTLFKMKVSLSGKEELAVICWKSFLFHLHLSFGSVLNPCPCLMALHGSQQAAWPAKALMTCVRWHVEL